MTKTHSRPVAAWFLGLVLATEAGVAQPRPSLRGELSPYLVRSAAEPVAWRPWSAAAAAEARGAGRLILLSIGEAASRESYATDQRLFADVQIAQTLNTRFVPVKVDRHERPDLEHALATLLGVEAARTPGSAVLFLTSDGLPFHVALPAEQDPPAFRGLLDHLASAYEKDPSSLQAEARQRLASARPTPGRSNVPAGSISLEALVGRVVDGVLADGSRNAVVPAASHGRLRLLLEEHARTGRPEPLRSAAAALETLARGALRDHLAGGFHGGLSRQGSPGFEKLLCHNALLLRAYAEAAAVTGDLLLRDVAYETASWAIRDMRDVTGLFWSSLAAPTEGDEGSYYLWTREEVFRWLGPGRGAELLGVYELRPPGLLVLKGSAFTGLGSSREVLLNRRGRRVRLPVDDEALTAWNGLMIGALAREGRLLRRSSDVEAARRAAEALLARAGPLTALKRCIRGGEARVKAPLEDYAFLAEGLIELHQATGEVRWRTEAAAVVEAAVLRFWDEDGGGFHEAEAGERLPLRLKRARDGALPSPNGVMASVLFRLAGATGEQRYAHLGRRTIEAFLPLLQQTPDGFETLAAALGESLDAAGRPAGTPSR